MVQQAHKRTTQLLMDKREEVEKVAQLLLAKEVLSRFVPPAVCWTSILLINFVIYREDMIALIGPRPFEKSE